MNIRHLKGQVQMGPTIHHLGTMNHFALNNQEDVQTFQLINENYELLMVIEEKSGGQRSHQGSPSEHQE